TPPRGGVVRRLSTFFRRCFSIFPDLSRTFRFFPPPPPRGLSSLGRKLLRDQAPGLKTAADSLPGCRRNLLSLGIGHAFASGHAQDTKSDEFSGSGNGPVGDPAPPI